MGHLITTANLLCRRLVIEIERFWHLVCVNLKREWSNTHQCTNVDGWCTNRIIFSIHVPSQVDFFCLPFLNHDQPWSQFYLQLYFFLTPFLVFFPLISICFGFFPCPPTQFLLFCFWNCSHPPTYYSPLSRTNLFTYIFKLKVDSSPSTYSPIN